YNNTDKGYHEQFYVPYKTYPGKIIAIPGNHDGELFKFDGTSVGQKKTLEAFLKNFCRKKPGVPSGAGTIYREMVSQPGVYWYLDAPFVDIIGLYSNMAENPGYISGASIGNKQKEWLTRTLTTIAKNRKKGPRKALVVAVHHPPISTSGHDSSTAMLADIDDSCNKAGVIYDAMLAAHAHNYQSYTRSKTFAGKKMQIPFFVAGGGGRVAQSVKPAGGTVGDATFDKSLRGYGYLTVNATKDKLTIRFTQVDTKNNGKKKTFDTVTVDLKTNKTKRS
ncbi:MAG: metallophosphoesterase, partial [Bacteroidota bacterium]|nr:metallophosphoesterase [Bacteroidota bacterium]